MVSMSHRTMHNESSFALYFDILLFAVKELVNLPIDKSLWYAIGQELGIKDYKLNEIKVDNEHKPNHSLACTTSMFLYWIQVEEEPTYHKLVIALSAVGMREVATALCDKYGMLAVLFVYGWPAPRELFHKACFHNFVPESCI